MMKSFKWAIFVFVVSCFVLMLLFTASVLDGYFDGTSLGFAEKSHSSGNIPIDSFQVYTAHATWHEWVLALCFMALAICLVYGFGSVRIVAAGVLNPLVYIFYFLVMARHGGLLLSASALHASLSSARLFNILIASSFGIGIAAVVRLRRSRAGRT